MKISILKIPFEDL